MQIIFRIWQELFFFHCKKHAKGCWEEEAISSWVSKPIQIIQGSMEGLKEEKPTPLQAQQKPIFPCPFSQPTFVFTWLNRELIKLVEISPRQEQQPFFHCNESYVVLTHPCSFCCCPDLSAMLNTLFLVRISSQPL